jgi:hypothetical protein
MLALWLAGISEVGATKPLWPISLRLDQHHTGMEFATAKISIKARIRPPPDPNPEPPPDPEPQPGRTQTFSPGADPYPEPMRM